MKTRNVNTTNKELNITVEHVYEVPQTVEEFTNKYELNEAQVCELASKTYVISMQQAIRVALKTLKPEEVQQGIKDGKYNPYLTQAKQQMARVDKVNKDVSKLTLEQKRELANSLLADLENDTDLESDTDLENEAGNETN
jgi:hypothetical protein